MTIPPGVNVVTVPQAPLIHPINIVAHPGSTFAGMGVLFGIIAQVWALGPPASVLGWLWFVAQVAWAVLSWLGR